MENKIERKYPPLASSNILDQDEMMNTLGGADCKRGCTQACKTMYKMGPPEEPIDEEEDPEML